MNVSARRLRAARNAGIVPRMPSICIGDGEGAGLGRQLCSDVDAPVDVVVYHAVVVIPEDVQGQFRALDHTAQQLQSRAGL